MHEFFKGWRRKVGCVTLVMTLAVLWMWVRSHSFSDSAQFYSTSNRFNLLLMNRGSVLWTVYKVTPQTPLMEQGWTTHNASQHDFIGKLGNGYRWNFKYAGFGFGDVIDKPTSPQSTFYVIPHLMVANLLGLLSLCLILWPRKRVSPTERVADAG